jgi:hypothetical protein
MEMVRWRKRRVMRAPERSLNNNKEEERGKEIEEGGKEEGVRVSNTAQSTHHNTHSTSAQQHTQHRRTWSAPTPP